MKDSITGDIGPAYDGILPTPAQRGRSHELPAETHFHNWYTNKQPPMTCASSTKRGDSLHHRAQTHHSQSFPTYYYFCTWHKATMNYLLVMVRLTSLPVTSCRVAQPLAKWLTRNKPSSNNEIYSIGIQPIYTHTLVSQQFSKPFSNSQSVDGLRRHLMYKCTHEA